MRGVARRLLLGACTLLAGCGARTGLGEPEARDAAPVESRDGGLDAPLRTPPDVGADAPRVDASPISRPDASTLDAWRTPDGHVPDASAPDAITLDASVPDAGDPCATEPTSLMAPVCERELDARDATLSCPGGFVDVVARGRGTLRWECDGSRAEAEFAAGTYRGSRMGESFALCIQTEFDYLDGCRWRSSQRITGDLDDGTLALSYREMAIVSDGACFPECTAEASIAVP